MTPERVLKTIARELVQTGIYKSEQSALKALAVEQAAKKIRGYRRVVNQLQRKYQVKNLEEFSRQIKGRAKPHQEDDWLEWKAALEMLEGWEKTLRELTQREV